MRDIIRVCVYLQYKRLDCGFRTEGKLCDVFLFYFVFVLYLLEIFSALP